MKQEFETDHLNAKQKRIAKIVVKAVTKALGQKPSTGGQKTFYTPEEWKQRGEEYGRESELVVVYDGGDFHDVCSTSAGWYALHDIFNEELNKAGYFFEQCTGWYGAVYKA